MSIVFDASSLIAQFSEKTPIVNYLLREGEEQKHAFDKYSILLSQQSQLLQKFMGRYTHNNSNTLKYFLHKNHQLQQKQQSKQSQQSQSANTCRSYPSQNITASSLIFQQERLPTTERAQLKCSSMIPAVVSSYRHSSLIKPAITPTLFQKKFSSQKVANIIRKKQQKRRRQQEKACHSHLSIHSMRNKKQEYDHSLSLNKGNQNKQNQQFQQCSEGVQSLKLKLNQIIHEQDEQLKSIANLYVKKSFPKDQNAANANNVNDAAIVPTQIKWTNTRVGSGMMGAPVHKHHIDFINQIIIQKQHLEEDESQNTSTVNFINQDQDQILQNETKRQYQWLRDRMEKRFAKDKNQHQKHICLTERSENRTNRSISMSSPLSNAQSIAQQKINQNHKSSYSSSISNKIQSIFKNTQRHASQTERCSHFQNNTINKSLFSKMSDILKAKQTLKQSVPYSLQNYDESESEEEPNNNFQRIIDPSIEYVPYHSNQPKTYQEFVRSILNRQNFNSLKSKATKYNIQLNRLKPKFEIYNGNLTPTRILIARVSNLQQKADQKREYIHQNYNPLFIKQFGLQHKIKQNSIKGKQCFKRIQNKKCIQQQNEQKQPTEAFLSNLQSEYNQEQSSDGQVSWQPDSDIYAGVNSNDTLGIVQDYAKYLEIQKQNLF